MNEYDFFSDQMGPIVAQGSSFLDLTQLHGRLRFAMFDFKKVISSDDIVELLRLPPASRVVRGAVRWDIGAAVDPEMFYRIGIRGEEAFFLNTELTGSPSFLNSEEEFYDDSSSSPRFAQQVPSTGEQLVKFEATSGGGSEEHELIGYMFYVVRK